MPTMINYIINTLILNTKYVNAIKKCEEFIKQNVNLRFKNLYLALRNMLGGQSYQWCK